MPLFKKKIKGISRMPPGESTSSHMPSRVQSDATSVSSPQNHFPRPNKTPCIACAYSAPNFRHEIERLKTYEDGWPLTFLQPSHMSAAGFYYTKEGDVVRCPFCGVEVGSWEPGDDPIDDHKKWSPSCDFVKKLPCGNVPLEVTSLFQQENLESYDTCGPYGMEIRPFSGPERASAIPNLENLGVMKTYKCAAPEFCTLESRLKTFDSWPISMPQRPKQLAGAGFYYTGLGDKTKCFYCGGGLSKWEPNDDPWEEHARWFSKCGFVLIQKGSPYVAQVTGSTNALLTTEAVKEIQQEDEVSQVVKSVASLQHHHQQQQPPPLPPKNLNRLKNTLRVEETTAELEQLQTSVPQVEEAKLCKVCYEEERSIVFLPCGHLVCCAKCATSLHQCAVCRQEIQAVVRAFMS